MVVEQMLSGSVGKILDFQNENGNMREIIKRNYLLWTRLQGCMGGLYITFPITVVSYSLVQVPGIKGSNSTFVPGSGLLTVKRLV